MADDDSAMNFLRDFFAPDAPTQVNVKVQGGQQGYAPQQQQQQSNPWDGAFSLYAPQQVQQYEQQQQAAAPQYQAPPRQQNAFDYGANGVTGNGQISYQDHARLMAELTKGQYEEALRNRNNGTGGMGDNQIQNIMHEMQRYQNEAATGRSTMMFARPQFEVPWETYNEINRLDSYGRTQNLESMLPGVLQGQNTGERWRGFEATPIGTSFGGGDGGGDAWGTAMPGPQLPAGMREASYTTGSGGGGPSYTPLISTGPNGIINQYTPNGQGGYIRGQVNGGDTAFNRPFGGYNQPPLIAMGAPGNPFGAPVPQVRDWNGGPAGQVYGPSNDDFNIPGAEWTGFKDFYDQPPTPQGWRPGEPNPNDPDGMFSFGGGQAKPISDGYTPLNDDFNIPGAEWTDFKDFYDADQGNQYLQPPQIPQLDPRQYDERTDAQRSSDAFRAANPLIYGDPLSAGQQEEEARMRQPVSQADLDNQEVTGWGGNKSTMLPWSVPDSYDVQQAGAPSSEDFLVGEGYGDFREPGGVQSFLDNIQNGVGGPRPPAPPFSGFDQWQPGNSPEGRAPDSDYQDRKNTSDVFNKFGGSNLAWGIPNPFQVEQKPAYQGEYDPTLIPMSAMRGGVPSFVGPLNQRGSLASGDVGSFNQGVLDAYYGYSKQEDPYMKLPAKLRSKFLNESKTAFDR